MIGHVYSHRQRNWKHPEKNPHLFPQTFTDDHINVANE